MTASPLPPTPRSVPPGCHASPAPPGPPGPAAGSPVERPPSAEPPSPATLAELTAYAAWAYPGREALVEGGHRWSFATLHARTVRSAKAALAHGLRKGDRVAVWAPNSRHWITAALGAVCAGGVLVPLNTRYKPAEAADILRRSRARFLFTVGPFLGTDYARALAGAGEELPDLELTVTLPTAGEAEEAGDAVEAGRAAEVDEAKEAEESEETGETDKPAEGAGAIQHEPGGGGHGESYARYLDSAARVTDGQYAARAEDVLPDDLSDILYTSGTTGRPKGVEVTHRQTLGAFTAWARAVGLREGDRYLLTNPFFHTFGYKAGVLACLLTGVTMLPEAVYDAGRALRRIAEERVSVLMGPPTVFHTLVRHPGRSAADLSALRLAGTGAAGVPVRLVAEIREQLGVADVFTAYGLSESCGVATVCPASADAATVAHTVGPPLPGVELRVVTGDGTPAAPGEQGEVLLRGPYVMRGYSDDPQATAAAVDADGWLHTGDVGSVDERGYLTLTDRLKDMYIVGGFNTYPAEIEQALRAHPDVADVAVIGVPDERLGEVGAAYVVPRPGADPAALPDALSAWARTRLANYKLPRTVTTVPDLPRNASGKVLKNVLRARHRTGTAQS
ncbi:AMP-binding protein [Streptomyces albus]|uniref:AMP-binding protein n=1 Tax=Streptomyces albus TaxID=1888 RepID=UPI0024AD1378|nr:AMP-binding protein [Streptomyces albus]MDI6409255.1 AMP-binding protein [Streptomyces albus]